MNTTDVVGLIANLTQIFPVIVSAVRSFGDIIMEPPWVIFLGIGLLYAGVKIGIKVFRAAKK